ncbi:MAG: HD domain-containing phosphohydrolase [Nitrospirota bacterium]
MAEKVLFVDDEENILRSLRRLLMDEDFEVITANSGEEALEILKNNHDIGLIVSDQRMPGLTGVDFLEKAKEIAPDALRIVLTGYADVNAAIEAINRGGAYRYITKPWKDEELIQVIRDAVQRYSLITENKRLTEIIKRQNEELKNWNTQLEVRVQEQTIDIQNQNKTLQELNEQLKRNFRNSIEAFSGMIEMRDKTVSSHSKNVAALARQTALSMSLPEHDISNIFVAALLHDIGKIGIPDSILMKDTDTLNDYERKEYELHPIRGQVAIDSIEGFQEVGILIRHHHERVDGLGYPDGLKKKAIPVGSRIIALADAFDRIANSSFSSARGNYEKIISEIEFYLDTKFDRIAFQSMRPIVKKHISYAQGYLDEVEIHPDKLMPGMVLSRDVRSGTGLLLLAHGVVLDQKVIRGLQRYYEIDPFKNGIFVRRNK